MTGEPSLKMQDTCFCGGGEMVSLDYYSNVGNRKPPGARFVSNIYRHQSILVVRGESGKTTIFLVSSEGSTQGCPLVLPLIIQLKSEFPQVKSPWYADDGAAAGT